MPESDHDIERERLRARWLSRVVAQLPRGDFWSRLGTYALLTLLICVLLLHIAREIWDGALTGCPGYDGASHMREAEALCRDP
ncbi:hypothetical protein MCBMB27_00900 [Methylobacterium phyllosphaerae]|uniref:Uncharacterized protein n=1 Tax=Methylobacterium phyllosphaerae TaxID=418223 RepID=A0AAE8HY29_9HYPH|nr:MULTISPECIES: hypothetical protein [Methylobacterium]APT30191.1 hypothetical protein MCBMB27_00900 [Methylobacterium phyllosphaerae]SFH70459.1 hypothetical protein SAMN05192567_14714 [Methylobacterium phyllosphaerae]